MRQPGQLDGRDPAPHVEVDDLALASLARRAHHVVVRGIEEEIVEHLVERDAPHGKRALLGQPFPLPARLRHRADTVLVGRETELGELRALWWDVREGRGARLALVTGEAGMGKSRLGQELAGEVHEQGGVVLHGTASEDLLMPHQHFVDALGHFFAVASPDELRRRVEPRAADLEPVAPGLEQAGPRPEPDEGAPESRRYRLFDYEGAADAERVVVVMGSGAGAAGECVRHLVARGEKVGLVKVRLFRPFSAAAFLRALPPSVRSIAVLDCTKEPGAVGEPLWQDVVAALAVSDGNRLRIFDAPTQNLQWASAYQSSAAIDGDRLLTADLDGDGGEEIVLSGVAQAHVFRRAPAERIPAMTYMEDETPLTN